MQYEGFELQREYKSIHDSYPIYDERPIIGITANFSEGNAAVAEAYYYSVLEAGGIPLIIPPHKCRTSLIGTLRHIDALLITGGADIDPRYMGEEPDYSLLHEVNPKRDELELILALLADARALPMLGICRGMQALTVAFGGKLHQDLYAGIGGELLSHDQGTVERHKATHDVQVVAGSRLSRIFSSDRLAVNTFHHQSVKNLPCGFAVSACADDGVVESIESVDGRSIIGVQWHPEPFIMNGDRSMMPLFDWLIGEATLYHNAKKLHGKMLTVDSHCDTPMQFGNGYRLDQRSDTALVDLHKMDEGGLDVATMVAYLPQGERDAASLGKATENAIALLDGIEAHVEKNISSVVLGCNPDELYDIKVQGKKVVMRGVENGYAIGKDICNIERFRRMGVVYMTLCHNGDNDICDSARGAGEHGGLSSFGKDVVREMNRVGMLIDLSHAAETTFWQVLEQSAVPVVCSHSSCMSLCSHPRNLTDEQLRAIAGKGGVVQVTMYKGFLCDDGNATLDDFMAHLEHAIEVAGIDHVGIGTDFDGDGAVVGCSSASQLRNVTRELLRRGYSNSDIEKIWGANWLRVLRCVQEAAEV